jgi:MFS family permease
VIVRAIFGSIRWPALSAMTTLLVDKKHLGRANGIMQVGDAAMYIVSPLVAGILLSIIGVEGVIFADFVIFLFALISMIVVRIPNAMPSDEGKINKGSFFNEALYGWTYIRSNVRLFSLLLFFAATNFTLGIVIVLITPLILSFTSAEVLGRVLSLAGMGMLTGSLIMGIWGGPKRRIYGILGFTFLQGLLLLLGGLQPSIPLIIVATFTFLFCTPIVDGCSQAIWQSKVPTDIQGRVFAVRRMISMSTLPLA